jgi:hypothetical protein
MILSAVMMFRRFWRVLKHAQQDEEAKAAKKAQAAS